MSLKNKVPQKSTLDVRPNPKKKPPVQSYFNKIKTDLLPKFDSYLVVTQVFDMFYDDVEKVVRDK
jgi:hypothetical protein